MGVLAFNLSLETVTCYKCGVPFAFASHLMTTCRESGQSFFCPNGHSQAFCESEVDKLRKELARKEASLSAQKARADMAEASARAHKGKVTEMKNRIANGVCPCCRRSFQNLRRHMTTKHPEFKE